MFQLGNALQPPPNYVEGSFQSTLQMVSTYQNSFQATTPFIVQVHSYLALGKPRTSISPATHQHNREPCAVDTVGIHHLLQLCGGSGLGPQLHFNQPFKFFHCLRTILKASKGMTPHFPQKLISRELRNNSYSLRASQRRPDLPKSRHPTTALPEDNTRQRQYQVSISQHSYLYAIQSCVAQSYKICGRALKAFLSEGNSLMFSRSSFHTVAGPHILVEFNFFKLKVLW